MSEQMQVMFSGTEYQMGDMAIVLGSVTRRTNDLQQIYIFMSVLHYEACMLSRVESTLQSCATRVRESLRSLQLGLDSAKLTDFRRVKPPMFQELGDCFTPCHEALCYYHAGM